MRKLFLTFLFTLITTVSFAQFNPGRHHYNYDMRARIELAQYTVVDSLPLERISIYSPFDYDSDKVINMGSGDYIIEMPHKDKMIIRTNKDRTKAIVLYNSYCFGRHNEFTIKDNERRMILWYEDDEIYCGYIYDKFYKVCKYFESKKY